MDDTVKPNAAFPVSLSSYPCDCDGRTHTLERQSMMLCRQWFSLESPCSFGLRRAALDGNPSWGKGSIYISDMNDDRGSKS